MNLLEKRRPFHSEPGEFKHLDAETRESSCAPGNSARWLVVSMVSCVSKTPLCLHGTNEAFAR